MAGTRDANMNAPASCAILGLGYLGRPLAETLWQHGSRVAAWKKTLTSDDIALPIELATGDIAAQNGFQTAFARWQGIETWICLLPPSAFAHTPEAYPAAVRAWAQAAAHYGANHLIFTSSISVFGRHMGECREHTPPEPDPQNTAARRLIEAEAAVSAAAVPHTDILRLGGLYCAERHPLFSILAKQSRPHAREPANMLHRSRAAAALFQTACTPGGHRLRHLVETPHPSKQQFYTEQAARLGLPLPAFASGAASRRTVATLYPEFSDILAANP